MMDFIKTNLPIIEIVLRILSVLLTFFIGRWLAQKSRLGLKTLLAKQELPKSVVTVLVNVTYASIWLLTILMILALLGVPLYSLVGGVVLVLVILAVALREALGNFAATIIFALFKPFEPGDLIETLDTLGVVQELQLFNTLILAYDGKLHIFANGPIQNDGITNLTQMGKVRQDLRLSIRYKDDLPLAKKTLMEMLTADPRVLDDPPPIIFVKALGDNGVELQMWPYVRPEDYIEFPFDTLEQAKYRLEEVGIAIPFPQRDVHLYPEAEAAETGNQPD